GRTTNAVIARINMQHSAGSPYRGGAEVWIFNDAETVAEGIDHGALPTSSTGYGASPNVRSGYPLLPASRASALRKSSPAPSAVSTYAKSCLGRQPSSARASWLTFTRSIAGKSFQPRSA